MSSAGSTFGKVEIDSRFEELRRDWEGKPAFESIFRDVHLAIALFDAGRPLQSSLDPRAVALVEKHKPGGSTLSS